MKKIIETLQRKWAEYLLETLVITIGILAAFALNNWNEEAKNRETEASYLSSLNKDFLSNKEQFSFSLQTITTAKIVADSVQKYELPMNDSNWNQMRRWINHSIYHPQTFEPITGTIDALLSSGRIELIQSDTLKRLIISWNDVYQEYYKLLQEPLKEGVDKYQIFKQSNPNWADPQVRHSINWQLQLDYLFGQRVYQLKQIQINSTHLSLY